VDDCCTIDAVAKALLQAWSTSLYRNFFRLLNRKRQ